MLHFYLNGLHLEPTVDVYLYKSFRKKYRNMLRKDPQDFIENFTRRTVCHVPNVHILEERFIKNAKILKEGLTNLL